MRIRVRFKRPRKTTRIGKMYDNYYDSLNFDRLGESILTMNHMLDGALQRATLVASPRDAPSRPGRPHERI